jgi:6-pyruvoyltetrahydropterin/6-carboxytetrahydropterin synthase
VSFLDLKKQQIGTVLPILSVCSAARKKYDFTYSFVEVLPDLSLFKEIKQKLNKKPEIPVCYSMKVAVYRKEHFNAAHRLNNPNWSDEKNLAVFGKCNNYNYHGHNYDLIVKLEGPVDPYTGYVFDMKVLSDLIKEHVLNKFDHKNLNLDTDEFKDINPSAENIAVVIWNILRKEIDLKFDLTIRLYETERNFVEYCGS